VARKRGDRGSYLYWRKEESYPEFEGRGGGYLVKDAGNWRLAEPGPGSTPEKGGREKKNPLTQKISDLWNRQQGGGMGVMNKRRGKGPFIRTGNVPKGGIIFPERGQRRRHTRRTGFQKGIHGNCGGRSDLRGENKMFGSLNSLIVQLFQVQQPLTARRSGELLDDFLNQKDNRV